jgi:TonB family protein
MSRSLAVKNFYRIISVFLFASFLHGAAAAQKKDKVDVISKIFAESVIKDCKNLKPGRMVNFPKPDYPAEARAARIGGTILVTVRIDVKGAVSEIEAISGHKLLQTAATKAARKTKFSPTTCEGITVQSTALLTYNFIPASSTEGYFTPVQIGEFADLKTDSPYYEAVLNLTENYKLAFGYANKNFYPDAPLARGDFARFLRLTLDLLTERAAAVKKLPREIGLFNSHNPQRIVIAESIKDLKANAPFYDSVKTLLLKYDIALTNEKNEFQGKIHLTNNEVIDVWSKIFGAEAIPINFKRVTDGDRIISRGEFALFLQESLQVLTYKVLP